MLRIKLKFFAVFENFWNSRNFEIFGIFFEILVFFGIFQFFEIFAFSMLGNAKECNEK